jgi:hypothetical protein
MKAFIQAALAATLVVGATAQPHAHKHRHLSAKRHEHVVVEKRDAVTVTSVVAATVTEYVMDGKKVDLSQAEAGLKGGDFIVVGSTVPTFTPPPPPPPSPTSAPVSSASVQAGQFFELKSKSSSSAPLPTPSDPPATPSTPTSAAPKPAATGLNVAFPTGDDAPSCDIFPSAYGAVPVEWLGTDGWTSLQQPADSGFHLGVKINTIVAPTTGGCKPNMFCSYACPPGYHKSQWPVDSQGATGQSVGGLWCDANNKLRLTRPDHPFICEKGAGGVVVKNSLSQLVSVCGTDYPGSEAMVVPLAATPGGTFELTNPDSTNYYVWDGKPTTAQYYINPAGVSLENSCLWVSPTNRYDAGNWSPMNVGVGKDVHGVTYISIFDNKPTTDAKLAYNVKIHGDVSIECKYENGVYSSGNGNGCTVSFPPSLRAY